MTAFLSDRALALEQAMEFLLAAGLHLLDLAVVVGQDLFELLLLLLAPGHQGLELGEDVVVAVEPVAGRLLGELGATGGAGPSG